MYAIDFKVICAECSEELDIEQTYLNDVRDEVSFTAAPCESCRKAAIAQAIDELGSEEEEA